MKARHAALAIALVAAAALALYGDRSPAPDVAQPTAHASRAGTPAARAEADSTTIVPVRKAGTDDEVLAIVPRTAQAADRASHRSSVMFGQKSWAPPPAPPLEVVTKPTAPPVPYTYVGKKWADGEWTIFLAREDHTYRAKTGDVLDDTYRVQSIDASVLVLNYLPLKEEQKVSIE